MDNQFRNEYHRLIANLHKTGGHISSHFTQKLTPFDLSVQQYVVLRHLSDAYPNSLSAGELKEKMTNPNSDITRLTDRLVAKNLIVRELDPQNRRRVHLRLTNEMNQYVAKVAAEVNDFESVVSHLTGNEVHLMNTLLDKISSRIQ